jgi:branched-chain amino acid transport system substrate-binding protein
MTVTSLRTFLAPVVLAAFLGGCSPSAKPLVLGAAGPWSDNSMALTKEGIDLAVEEVNAKGGVDGRPIRIRYVDDHRSGALGAVVAESLVNDQSVLAVIGHVNSPALLAAAHLYDGHLVAVSSAATAPELSGISPWVFRLVPSDSLSGRAIGRFAGSLRPGARAAILYENDAYGRGLSRAFLSAFNGTIIASEPLDEKPTTFEPYVAYLKQVKADVVFSIGLERVGIALLTEAKRQRLDAAFIGGDAWAGITADSATAEGAYVGVPFTDADPRRNVRTFVGQFRARWGVSPAQDGAMAYDATRLLIEGLMAGARTRAALRSYLAGLTSAQPYQGITGPISFSQGGDPGVTPLVVTRVHRGALVPISWQK